MNDDEYEVDDHPRWYTVKPRTTSAEREHERTLLDQTLRNSLIAVALAGLVAADIANDCAWVCPTAEEVFFSLGEGLVQFGLEMGNAVAEIRQGPKGLV